jgi:hypothetical protein
LIKTVPGAKEQLMLTKPHRPAVAINGAVVNSIDGHGFHSVAQDKTRS